MVRKLVSVLLLGAGIYGTLLAIQDEWMPAATLSATQANAGERIRKEAAFVSGSSQGTRIR